MKISTLTCLFFLIVLSANAQNDYTLPRFVPPSPDAAALARYGNIPVDYSTGVPKIEIPIFNLKCGAIQVPITLSYHASGIKVRDMATPEGLGWVLNSGGAISRTILGMPDELLGKPIYKTSDYFDNAPRTSYADKYSIILDFQTLINNSFDVQSDRYTFNFAGKAGAFASDYITDSIKTIPYSPIKIKKYNANDTSQVYFEIVDENGTKYTFSSRETSLTTGETGGVTAWYLTKIVDAGSNEVDFYYSNSDVITSNFNSQVYIKGPIYVGDLPTSPTMATEYHPSQSTTTHHTIRLDSIICRTASIYFNYLLDRTDGRSTRLNKVTIRNSIDKRIVSQTTFYQSYFGASYKRMRLDSVIISGDGTIQNQTYSFGYINPNADMKTYWQTTGMFTSFVEDYWGYYNVQTNSSLIPGDIINLFDPSIPIQYKGNRNPRQDGMETYTLNQIKYPTGGRTVFTYECNNVGSNSYYPYSNSNNGNIGGLRIKQILDYANDTSQPVIRSYEYDSTYAVFDGITTENYEYVSSNFYYAKGHAVDPQGVGFRDDGVLGATSRNVYLSTSTIPASLQDESPVNYGKVTEYIGTASDNIGKTVYTYDIPTDFESDYINYSIHELRYAALYHVDRGIPICYLTNKAEFKKVDTGYKKIQEVNNIYTYLRDSSFLTGIRINQNENFYNNSPLPDGDPWWDIDDFLNSYIYENTIAYTEDNLLTESDEYSYGESKSDYIKTTTTYNYNLNTLQVTDKTVTNSKGEIIKTNYKYPLDYTISGTASNDIAKGIQFLQNNHVISPVVEQYTQRADTGGSNLRTVAAELNIYNPSNPFKDMTYAWQSAPATNFSPATISAGAATMDSRYKPALYFDRYDTYGNTIQQHRANDALYSYVWDYHNSYPIAEVVNTSQSDIAYTSFEADGKGSWSFNGSTIDNQGAITGTKAYALTSGPISRSSLSSVKKYLLSYWSKGSSASVSGGTQNNNYTGETINGWTYHSLQFTNTSSVTISGSGYIDELRLYPVGSQMTTYTYEPLTGMTAQCDANNTVTYYTYDALGRLAWIRDAHQNILKEYCYNYNDQPGNCQYYSNTAVLGTYTCSCGGDSTGSQVTDTIPAGKYWSSVSQSDANAQATSDLQANGQQYANTHGTCSAPLNVSVLYYNYTNYTVYLTLQFNGQNHYYTANPNSSGTLGSLIAGSYTVMASSSSSIACEAGCGDNNSGSGTSITLTGIQISQTCNSIYIDPN